MVFAPPHDTVLITDGGLATELEARGHDLSDDLWSARLLVDAPQEITAVHAAFFRAGAVFATTASYQASFDGFAERGIGRDDAARLMRRSVELATAARDEVGGQRWVAASIGPYGAALANGEEYVGRYGLSVSQLAALAPTADGDSCRCRRRRAGVGDGARRRRSRGARRPRSRPRRSGLAVLHDRRDDDACRATARRRLCGGGRCAGSRCGGRELLRTRRRRARYPGGTGGDGKARHRLPQQWRGVGRRSPDMGRLVRLVGRAGAAVGGRGRAHRRRVLPGAAR